MYHAVFSHDCSSMIKSCLIAGGKDSKEGRQWIPRANHKKTNLTTWDNHEWYLAERSGKFTRMQCVLDPSEKRSRQKISILANTLQLLSLTTLYQPTVLKRVVHTKTEEILHQQIQVQNEGQIEHGGSTGELVADEMTIEPGMDFRIQEISLQKFNKKEGKSRKQYIGWLVSAIMNHKIRMIWLQNRTANIRERRSARNQNKWFTVWKM